jgi:uncharacterized protein
MQLIWLLIGLISLGLGIIGIFLPLLPTVPFLLLATFCFARSSERLHGWLLSHPKLGPPIENWSRSGAISRRAKYAATASIAVTFGISLVLGLRPWILLVQALTLICVSLFIWTRPEA